MRKKSERSRFEYGLAIFLFFLTILSSIFSGWTVFKLTQETFPELTIEANFDIEKRAIKFKVINDDADNPARNVRIYIKQKNDTRNWILANPEITRDYYNTVRKGEPLELELGLALRNSEPTRRTTEKVPPQIYSVIVECENCDENKIVIEPPEVLVPNDYECSGGNREESSCIKIYFDP